MNDIMTWCVGGWFYLSLLCFLLHYNTSAAFLGRSLLDVKLSSNVFKCRSQQENQSFLQHFMGLQYGEGILPSSSSTASTQRTQLPLSSSLMPINKQQQQHDIVIIGGGLAGLSAALYVSQMDPTRRVTILDRETSGGKTIIGSMAAAGMLAPQSERLPPGPLLDICLASRRMFAEFCQFVESLAQQASPDHDFWSHLDAHVPLEEKHKHQMQPWNVGYVASGGFLAPAFAGDSVATWAPPSESAGNAVWLDAIQIREMEPHLHPNVVGGWWFPEDASVDARRLTCSLRAACHVAGVELCQGSSYEVTSLDLVDGSCRGIWLKNGHYLRPNKVLVANGSWMRQLLPVPLEPHKGQSLSLRMPSDRPPILRRVLFAQDSYLVPKADGRIIVGATVEAGSFDPNVTPAGLMHIMAYALQLVPGLADLPVEETWVGLRPTTPDKGPILGKTPWDNLFLAAGYWRNGVLLAPKTGQLVASILLDQTLAPDDQKLMDAFGWDRFTTPRGGAKLAAETRWAAALHPIHSRRTGAGVAAAVGTELGSYSVARSATSERQQDRTALLWSNNDDALERAAALGKQDASAYSAFGRTEDTSSNSAVDDAPATTTRFEGTSDAITVGSRSRSGSFPDDSDAEDTPTTKSSSSSRDLNSLYEQIQMNKTARNVVMHDPVEEERPDPGFRIYEADSFTGELKEVPPYTSLDNLAKKAGLSSTANASRPPASKESKEASREVVKSEDDDSIFNGYQAIEDAAAATRSHDEASDAMRKARVANRFGTLGMDFDVDPQQQPEHSDSSFVSNASGSNTSTDDTNRLRPKSTSHGGDYDETTLDGYQAYPSATNGDVEHDEEGDALREIRRRNRLGQSDINMTKIGAQRTP